MERLYDDRYHYTGYNDCRCHCRLRIYTAPGRAVVIATEERDNPGTSITNMAETLSARVGQEFKLLPGFLWIEHYPEHPEFSEEFSQITFPDGSDQPHWQHLTKAEVEALIEQTL